MSETKTLLAALRRHYIRPSGTGLEGGVFIPECGVNGQASSSRCDALYAGFTSTSGRLLVGHELKVSRSDWLRELAQVGKADWWADNCHEWWIVAPGPEVVPADELPAGWGLLHPGGRGSRMRVVVRATRHADRTPSWDACRSLLSRLDTLQRDVLVEHRQRIAEQERQRADLAAERRAEHEGRRALTPEQATRLSQLERIEQAMGRTVDTWWDEGGVRPEHAAAALSLVLAAHDLAPGNQEHVLRTLSDAVERMQSGIAAYGEAMAHLAAVQGRVTNR